MESLNKKQMLLGVITGVAIPAIYMLGIGILMAGGPPDTVRIGFAISTLIIPIALTLKYLKSRSMFWRAAAYTSSALIVLNILATLIF
ncbi:MAG: hypothetical protein Q7K26_05950 [bacterium]|nr:hypothetical protein [bacterium]